MRDDFQQLLRMKHRTALPKILLAAAECSPLSKTGGLADVAGALPKSLKALGMDTRVITPCHKGLKAAFSGRMKHICDFEISLGWRRQYVGLERLELFGLVFYLIDNEFYFGDKIYKGGLEEGEQYAFFQRAVLECIPHLDFQPDVLHCNDWHTAFMPFLIKSQYEGKPQSKLKTVLTIHNMAFQGKFDLGFVQDLLGVEPKWYRPEYIEHYGCVNFLKAGCVFADKINTVSPSYAQEILTPRFGEGLQDVLAYRSEDLSGIINGLDIDIFDPDSDPCLEYDLSEGADEFKAKSKSALCEELGINCAEGTPLIAMVTRMTAQKGFDIVQLAIERIMERNVAFVLLGTGDAHYESFMRSAEKRYPGRLCAYLNYSEELAHRIYAGADMLLMPSAFEPCGLSQMIAMRYGTLPIVHEVGGLKDSVQPYNKFTGEGTGFSFEEYSPDVMLETVDRALEVYARPEIFKGIRARAMAEDFSFESSAPEYGKLFLSILDDAQCVIKHDAYDEKFRDPMGAVTCGSKVELRITVEGGAQGAELLANGRAIEMEQSKNGFECVYTAPAEPTVVWYSFRLYDLNGEGEKIYCGSSGKYQLTVYDPAFKTPDWAKGAVMYQIYPDRFCREGDSWKKGAEYHRALGREIELHEDWDESVKWEGGEKYYPNDFYGGTLAGIEKHLPELKELGVDVIYLNPIFESDSNHRYNTADYMKIDPMLGDEEDLKRLCAKAKELEMRIILDGVFSHTGDDSVYFNKYGRYDSVGAYQSKDSEYYKWYDFKDHPEVYRSWWGFTTLPEVEETEPSWQDFVIKAEDGVMKHWMKAGAAGYRLDVADELPDEVIELMRRNIKAEDRNSFLLGEVWEDAVTNVSYGKRRDYSLGRGLDSVMNYPLRRGLIDFFIGAIDAHELCELLLHQKLNYPKPMYHCLMNLLSSHDTMRIRSVLGTGIDRRDMPREQQAEIVLSEEQHNLARARQRLLAALQFTLPGMPAVYYGEEEGMEGMCDPFCRGTYRKLDSELREYYGALAQLRHGSTALRAGEAAFCAPEDDLICMLRFDEYEAYLVIINRGEKHLVFCYDAEDFRGAPKDWLADLPELNGMTIPPMEVLIKKL